MGRHPKTGWPIWFATGIDRQHDDLIAKPVSDLVDHLGMSNRCGVDTNFVSSRPQQDIDVVDPARMTPQNLEREVRVGSDPRVRRLVFDRFGFRKVDIRYEQPVGGPGGGPITVLDLLFCPREPIDAVPTSLVVATMSAYWTPWLGRTAARRHARELERRAGGRALLPLLPCAVEEPPG